MKETGAIATSVEDSDGVYFVPSFSGLQVCLCVSVILFLSLNLAEFVVNTREFYTVLWHFKTFSVDVLQAPLNDPKACASFMGLKPSTTKRHLVRAILESIAFR